MSKIEDKLDNKDNLKALDQSNCLSSLKLLPQQVKSTWNEIEQISIPYSQKKISQLIFCGMGGSAYGARIIKSLYSSIIKLPIVIVDNYDLPIFADKNSLIICSSYSGNTEETLTCTKQSILKKFPTIGITSGGELAALLKKASYPVYTFDGSLNPSGQPRLGSGYMITAPLAILKKLNLIEIDSFTINRIIDRLEKNTPNLSQQNPFANNLAKQLAAKMSDKIINFIGADFLEGAIHSIRNPINETGKHFANYFILPELNHHLLDGLKFPESFKQSSIFVFIDSPFYKNKIRQRLKITKEVVTKNGLEATTIELTWENKLEQVFELIQLGSFISFYLAIIHGVDPAPVPWVNYLKEILKKRVPKP